MKEGMRKNKFATSEKKILVPAQNVIIQDRYILPIPELI